jgi:hypothetical protein
MVFIQILNKFHITIESTKEIQFINPICYKQPPNNLTIPYLFNTNKLVQKYNENVFTNTSVPTPIFKVMDN